MNELGDSNKTKALIASMEAVCEAKGRIRVNGATASERTFRMQKEVMRQFARTLHESGFMLEDSQNLGEKHINAVFDAWVHGKGLSAKTLQNQKSRVKQFFRWLGKPNLADYIGRIDARYADRLPNGFRVKTVAEESKSWRGNEVDLKELFRKAKAEDARFGAMLMMEKAFGLRKKEVLLTNPWKAGSASSLSVRENIAKGGKARDIEIREGEFGKMQLRVLEYAKQHCKRWETMAWPELSFKQAERRYFYLCERIGLTKEISGMTGHGLRAGFAEDMMLLDGILPSVLGGVTEMSTRAQRNQSKLKTSQAMGHNRMQITHAYYGKDLRHAQAGEILGHRVGEPLVLGKGTKGLLWVSEKPVAVEGSHGQHELPAELVELAYVTVQVVNGEGELARLSMDQFLDEHPVAFDAVAARLLSIGLDLREGDAK
jgi:site-specific recombinase XerD